MATHANEVIEYFRNVSRAYKQLHKKGVVVSMPNVDVSTEDLSNGFMYFVKLLSNAHHYDFGNMLSLLKTVPRKPIPVNSIFTGEDQKFLMLPHNPITMSFTTWFEEAKVERKLLFLIYSVSKGRVEHLDNLLGDGMDDLVVITVIDVCLILKTQKNIFKRVLNFDFDMGVFFELSSIFLKATDVNRGCEDNNMALSAFIPKPLAKYGSAVFDNYFKTGSKEAFNDIAMWSKYYSYCACLALRLLQAKNIVVVNKEPSTKQQKERKRQGKAPLFTYKTLALSRPGTVIKNTSISSQDREIGLGLMPLHYCQGHFKTYTKDRPLFGKYVGDFWWEPHVRGNSENGIIEKDYKVMH